MHGMGSGYEHGAQGYVFTGTSTLALPLFSLPRPMKGDLAMGGTQLGPKWQA